MNGGGAIGGCTFLSLIHTDILEEGTLKTQSSLEPELNSLSYPKGILTKYQNFAMSFSRWKQWYRYTQLRWRRAHCSFINSDLLWNENLSSQTSLESKLNSLSCPIEMFTNHKNFAMSYSSSWRKQWYWYILVSGTDYPRNTMKQMFNFILLSIHHYLIHHFLFIITWWIENVLWDGLDRAHLRYSIGHNSF